MEVKGETAAVRDPSLRELENTSKCVVHLKRTWHLPPIRQVRLQRRMSIYVGKFCYCWPQCNSNHLTNCSSSLRIFSE